MSITKPQLKMPRRSPSTPLIVANWKMQLGIEQTHQRFDDLKQQLRQVRGRYQAVVCPSFETLGGMKKLLRATELKLGAQDVFWDDRGPYTGEVSPLNLREAGVTYAIIGHSERRQHLGETNAMVGRKVISALGHGLTPIVCVGETAHERNDGRHERVVAQQLQAAFRTCPPPPRSNRIYIAYEPIWAIGTGEAASPEDALTMLTVIHHTLMEIYSPEQVTQGFRVIYGGSVTESNVTQYVQTDKYHGALVGTASLDPVKFSQLISNIINHFNH